MTRNVTIERPEAALHKQKRAMLTRKQLLRAARAVFARDGFEHARIEEIASKAGKTRGAFYDNFNDKEDVFFAIFEENIDREMAELGPLIAGMSTFEQRVEALGEYLSRLAEDRERMLLGLEFKLYAIRHPHKRKRLAALHSAMRVRGSIPELNQLLPVMTGESADARMGDCVAVCGLMDGLALNHFFNSETFDERDMARYLKAYLHQTVTGRVDQKSSKNHDWASHTSL
jgi:AcrR family transcriptional regulator